MKLIDIPDVSIPDIPNNTPEYLSRPYPKGSFPLHLLSAVIGGRGTGKTTFALKMLKWYDKSKSFDRIIIFSTTAHKDPKMKDFITSKTNAEIVHYKGYSDADLKNEMLKMEADIEAYRYYIKKLKIWSRFVSNDYDIDKMSYDDIWTLNEMNMEKPECPTKSGMFPSHCCVFDDLVGCRVFNANLSGLANHLLISHRHYSCSVLVLSQSITNFIPKQIRTNNIGLWVLFPTKCEKSMKDISEDVASKVSPDAFCNAWRFVGKHKHMPLVCDYDTIEDDKRFRMGLDKWIVMNNASKEQDIKLQQIEIVKKNV